MLAIIARATRGLRRVHPTRPPLALHRVTGRSSLAGRRDLVPTGGGDRVDGPASVGGGCGERVGALHLFHSKPVDEEPILLVSVPLTVSVPRHLATNCHGFVFSIEATCTSVCEFYTTVAAAHARDAIVASAQEAAKTEMMREGWSYELLNEDSTKGRFAKHVEQRMVSSARSSKNDGYCLHELSYTVTAMRLDPVATLASAAVQYQDPDVSLVAAACVELVHQIRVDGAAELMRSMPERLEEASKASRIFGKIYHADRTGSSPQRRSWIYGLFLFIVSFVLVLPFALAVYIYKFPEDWAAKSDATIEAYANSFRYHLSGGWMGETLVNRHKRLAAEAEQQLLEEKRKKEQELMRLKREEERRRKEEERRRKDEACPTWRRAEADAIRRMGPLGRFVYCNDFFKRRGSKRYPC